MNDAPHLEVAVSLFALNLQDVSDQIVVKSWEISDAIVVAHNSNAVVSVAIEVAAFLLHALSRALPPIDNDYLNDFVYSPTVRMCCRGMGVFVEKLQDAGAFSIPVYFGDDVEEETLTKVNDRAGEYKDFLRLVASMTQVKADAVSYAGRMIAEIVTDDNPEPVLATAEFLLLQALESLDFKKISAHVQAGLTLELLTYLRSHENE